MVVRLPVDPIVELLAREFADAGHLPSTKVEAYRLGLPEQTWKGLRRRRMVNVFQIDRICVDGLGLHPLVLYGDAWIDAADTVEDCAPDGQLVFDEVA